jgi:hypothetical protein
MKMIYKITQKVEFELLSANLSLNIESFPTRIETKTICNYYLLAFSHISFFLDKK